MPRPKKVISDFDIKLGEAIAYARQDPEKTRLTQEELAEATGIPLSTLQRREKGANEVTVSELERIAHAIGTTPAAIVNKALAAYGGIERLMAENRTTTSEMPDNLAPDDNVTYIGRQQPPLHAAADDKPKK